MTGTRRWLAGITTLALALCLAVAGCATGKDAQDAGVGSERTSDVAAADAAPETGKGRQDMDRQGYSMRETWCQNGDREIFGVAYVPDAGERHPLIIFAHELGQDHTSGERYAERLAEAGYAAYVFDFCGGTVGGNRSDGDNVGMSVMTEASDLEAVLSEAATWDFVDPDRIFLLGGSQGAVVTSVVGARSQDKVAAMMLMYPPLTLADEMRERFSTPDAVPEEFNMFGGWIRVGRNYATDVWDLHPYEVLAGYEGDVLLLHGDADSVVDLSVSERAADVIAHCEYHTIAGGTHEFFGPQFEDAVDYILDFLGRHCDR